MDHLVDAQGARQCQGSNTSMHRKHSAHQAVLLPCNFFFFAYFFGKVHNLWYWGNTDAVLLRSGSGYFWGHCSDAGDQALALCMQNPHSNPLNYLPGPHACFKLFSGSPLSESPKELALPGLTAFIFVILWKEKGNGKGKRGSCLYPAVKRDHTDV